MMQTVEFQPNIPVDLALKYADGKPVKSRGPVARFMFTTTDDRALFLDESIAKRIQALNLQPGEAFRACKAVNGNSVEWRFERLGEQKDGTYILPKLGGAAPSPEATAPSSHLQSQQNTQNPITPAALPQRVLNPAGATRSPEFRTVALGSIIIEDVNLLTDAMASGIEYAKKYSGAVGNDDIRALAITVYIQHMRSRV